MFLFPRPLLPHPYHDAALARAYEQGHQAGLTLGLLAGAVLAVAILLFALALAKR